MEAWNLKPWKSMGIYKNESMGRMVFSSILLLIILRKHGKHGKKAWKAWEESMESMGKHGIGYFKENVNIHIFPEKFELGSGKEILRPRLGGLRACFPEIVKFMSGFYHFPDRAMNVLLNNTLLEIAREGFPRNLLFLEYRPSLLWLKNVNFNLKKN